MPVDLGVLPQPLPPPPAPGHRRWAVFVLSGALLVGGLVVLFWPQDHTRMSLWFWCCVLVLPFTPGLALYALRLAAHERSREYCESWNRRRAEQRRTLVQQGRRAIGLLATSYCTGAGNNRIAQALRSGSKPLQAVFESSQALAVRSSRLAPPALLHTEDEYVERLSACIAQVMAGIEPDLPAEPLQVRIRHNQVLTDEQVLALWRERPAVGQVVFAAEDDGLMWLDPWLDQSGDGRPVLSLEFNLFLEPVAGQAESVSAVLLAPAHWCAEQRIGPMAWVHRPVGPGLAAHVLKDALRWGELRTDAEEYFSWRSQLSNEASSDAIIAMRAAGLAFDIAKGHGLDDSLGLPGCAVGNLVLIVAGEQAATDRQAQLLLLQDMTAHACVVQPVSRTGIKDQS